MTEPTSEDVRIVGRYALHQEIAAGGMATVHLGRLLGPAGFSRTVAVKRLHAQYAKDPEFVSMFLDEARLAARIRHPNVVSTLDIVALEGEIFIVMDYVEGESLARLIRTARNRGERIPTKVALSVMTNVLYGLHGAHEAKGERGEPLGIVHRDVSPQNILVDTQGSARMVDFGVAKAVGRLQTTRDGQLKGKLAYMAPEQLRGHKVDARTDVFAASIVLWELLTAQRLFQGENEAATFGKILECDVKAPSAVGADTSPELDAIVQKGLAGKPDERWESALDMAEALEHAARERPTQRELGRWVRTLAEETLSRRAQAVRELESHSAVSELVGSADPRELRASISGATPEAPAAPPPPPVPPARASASTLTEPMREQAAEAPPEPAPSHDSVAPTQVTESASALAEASSSGMLRAPAVPEEAADEEPTRLAESRLPPAEPERAAPVPAPPPIPFPIEEPSGSSQVSSIALERAKTAPPPPGARRKNAAVIIAAIGLSGVALLGLVVLAVAFGSRSKDETGEPAPKGAAPALPTVAPTLPKTAEPDPIEPPSASAAPAPVESSKPPAAVKPKPEPAAKPTATSKPKPAAKPNCNPPYTLDKDGTRIPKLECL